MNAARGVFDWEASVMKRFDRIGLANIVCLIGACVVASGCGSSPNGDSVSDPSSSEAANAASPGGGPSTTPEVTADPSASGEKHTVCGNVDTGDAFFPETYSFPLMNAKLSKYPVFADAIGLASVSSCDEARAFMKAYNEYLKSNPTFDDELSPKTDAYQRWIAEGIQDPDPPEQKIFDGVLDEDLDVVAFVRASAPGEGTDKIYLCSATRLAGPLFLTAAHCLPNVTANPVKNMHIWIKRARGDGTYGYYNQGAAPVIELAFLADGEHVAGYMGTGDQKHDLAVIHVRPESEKTLSKDALAWSSGLSLSTRTPVEADLVQLMGWGASTDPEPASAARLHVAGHPVQIQTVQDSWFGIANHESNLSDSVKMCKGDSGGPARLLSSANGNVTGVLSGWTGPGDPLALCSPLNVVQNWTRVDIYINENRQILATLQKGLRSKPYVCKFHYTGTSPDPEGVNAAFDCKGQ